MHPACDAALGTAQETNRAPPISLHDRTTVSWRVIAFKLVGWRTRVDRHNSFTEPNDRRSPDLSSPVVTLFSLNSFIS
jgi:hypothetical protein